MLSIVKSMSLLGLDGCLIYVQVDVSMGIPGWDIVGLPDTSVKEAKERVRTAIKNSGYELQSRKIIVNLAPADTKKEGSAFDLPIAIGILLCTGVIGQISEDIAFIGELSLDGKINKVNGSMFDFNEVKGQENIKRALEIAAAGRTQLFINRKSRLTGKQ